MPAKKAVVKAKPKSRLCNATKTAIQADLKKRGIKQVAKKHPGEMSKVMRDMPINMATKTLTLPISAADIEKSLEENGQNSAIACVVIQSLVRRFRPLYATVGNNVVTMIRARGNGKERYKLDPDTRKARAEFDKNGTFPARKAVLIPIEEQEILNHNRYQRKSAAKRKSLSPLKPVNSKVESRRTGSLRTYNLQEELKKLRRLEKQEAAA